MLEWRAEEHAAEMPESFRSYAPAHSREQVVGLLTQELGAAVERLERVDLGVVNAVYAARLANGLDC